MAKKYYLQFPLCLLGLPLDGETADAIGRKRINSIFAFGLFEFGYKLSEDMSDSELLKCVEEDVSKTDLPFGFKKNKRKHLEYVLAQERFGVARGHISLAWEMYKQCSNHVRDQRVRHGTDALCRIRGDVAWLVISGEIRWRDFSTLAAVYSIIGDKSHPVLIRRNMIQARQTGCKSVDVMRENRAQPLTEAQIRYTLDSLETAGWFCRVQASRRKVYFSHRMTRDEVEDWLKQKAFKQSRVNKNRKKDRDLQAELARLRKGAYPSDTSFSETPQSSHKITTIIESDFIESNFTESNLSQCSLPLAVVEDHTKE